MPLAIPSPDFGFPYTIHPGMIRSAVNAGDSVAAQGVNAAHYLRALGSGVISSIGIYINTQSGNICVGVYSNSGVGRSAVPAAQKATSGSVACPATGYREVALTSTVAVRAGDWLAVAADNTTAKFGSLLGSAGDLNTGLGVQFRQATAFPLPDPAASLTATVGYNIFLVGV